MSHWQRADDLYHTLTKGDRPVGADANKRPWLAALLSAVIPSAGQFSNRQFEKGILLFLSFFGLLLLLGLGALIYWLVGREEPRCVQLFWVGVGVAGAVWLAGVLDAYRTASALRAGRLVVRYSWWRQLLHAVLTKVPYLGAAIPEATVKPEELQKGVKEAAAEVVQKKLASHTLSKLARIGLFGAALVLLIAGLALGWGWLVAVGGVVLAAGILGLVF